MLDTQGKNRHRIGHYVSAKQIIGANLLSVQAAYIQPVSPAPPLQ